MTPQEEALQLQVSNLPVFKEVITDLEGLRKGQEALGAYVAEGFTKGKDRMDGLEDMFKDHINTTKDNHKDSMKAISDLNVEVKDNKIKDLSLEKAKEAEAFKAYKEKVWSIVKIVFSGVFGALVTAFAIIFGLK